MHNAKIVALSNIELFKELPEEVLDDLSRRCSWQRFHPNEQIIDRHSNSRVDTLENLPH